MNGGRRVAVLGAATASFACLDGQDERPAMTVI
jgi:hypothetical protein